MRIDVSALLVSLGISGQEIGRELIAHCPNPKHDDKDPSWRIVVDTADPKYGSHKCWSCDLRGGPVELAATVWGVSVADARDRLGANDLPAPPIRVRMPRFSVERTELQLPNGVVIPDSVDTWAEPFRSYLLLRGTQLQTAVSWGIGYAETGRLAGRIVWPVHTGGQLVTYSAREVDFRKWIRNVLPRIGVAQPNRVDDWPMDRWRTLSNRLESAIGNETKLAAVVNRWAQQARSVGRVRYITAAENDGAQSRRSIYGYDYVFPPSGPVTLVEGAMKANLLAQSGWPNPIAILGRALTQERLALLSCFDRIYDALDPDDAGIQASSELREGLPRHDVIRVELTRPVDEMTEKERRILLANTLSRQGATCSG